MYKTLICSLIISQIYSAANSNIFDGNKTNSSCVTPELVGNINQLHNEFSYNSKMTLDDNITISWENVTTIAGLGFTYTPSIGSMFIHLFLLYSCCLLTYFKFCRACHSQIMPILILSFLFELVFKIASRTMAVFELIPNFVSSSIVYGMRLIIFFFAIRIFLVNLFSQPNVQIINENVLGATIETKTRTAGRPKKT